LVREIVTISLSPEERRALEDLAHERRLTRSGAVQYLLQSHFKSRLNTVTQGLNTGQNPPTVRSDKVLSWWNELAGRHGLPRMKEFGADRKKHLRGRTRDHPNLAAEIERELEVGLSDFAKGDNGTWKLSFPWLIKSPANLAKFLEGQYRPKGALSEREKKRDERGWEI
jgi:hypothetical protein